MNKKQSAAKRLTPELTFEVDKFFEFTDTIKQPQSSPVSAIPGDNHSTPTPKSAAKKKGSITVEDRRRLQLLEILLNNCMNAAKAVQTKRAAKIVQLIQDARLQVQELHSNEA